MAQDPLTTISVCNFPLEAVSEKPFLQTPNFSNIFLKFDEKATTIGFASFNNLLCLTLGDSIFQLEDKKAVAAQVAKIQVPASQVLLPKQVELFSAIELDHGSPPPDTLQKSKLIKNAYFRVQDEFLYSEYHFGPLRYIFYVSTNQLSKPLEYGEAHIMSQMFIPL